MNLSNLEEQLVQQNPHWLTPPVTIPGSLRDIFPIFMHELTHSPLIITISGARRHGKTYLIKQALVDLHLSHHIPTHNILYFQFSTSHNRPDIINSLSELFLKKYATTGPKYLFFDEVQFINHWQDQIKTLYDLQPDLKFVVLGSTSLFYRQKSHESLAGRLYKLTLPPLTFSEYCRFCNITPPSSDRADFLTHLPLYHSSFRTYLAYGQYPELAANPKLDAPKYITDLTDQIINFDIPYFLPKLDRAIFSDLIKILAHDLGEEYSVSRLGNILGADRREISTYLKILEEVNLFQTCYNSAFSSQRKKLASSKKIYCLNLNLALHLNHFDISYLNDSRVFGRYLENYFFQRLLSRQTLPVEYFRRQSHELDFVVDENAFEIKSSPTHTSTYDVLASRLHKNLTILTLDDAYLF